MIKKIILFLLGTEPRFCVFPVSKLITEVTELTNLPHKMKVCLHIEHQDPVITVLLIFMLCL